MPPPEPPFRRLISGYTEDSNGCWIWNGYTKENGYGLIKVFGKMILAHRYSYELHKGEIPEGMEVLHSCDVKKCINPDHLSCGSHAQNMKEASDRGLMPKGHMHPMFGVKNPRPNQANRVVVLGREYESQKSAERNLGLGSGTVRYWLKQNNGKAKYAEK